MSCAIDSTGRGYCPHVMPRPEVWEVKILGYLKPKGLKEIMLSCPGSDENAYAEIIQFVHDCFQGGNGYEALRILHERHAGHSNRWIVTYHQLTTLKARESESVTDFIIMIKGLKKLYNILKRLKKTKKCD